MMSTSALHPDTLALVLRLIGSWEERFGSVDVHSSVARDPDATRALLERYVGRLHDNYPFFHPRYAGQMLKPPHPIAVAGYLAAMLINPNNHALDGGPATGAMEKEVIAAMLEAFGLPGDGLGHLTSSGTIANLEALWIARELHPEKRLLVSDQAHYTHVRMAGVLRMPIDVIPTDAQGRMEVDAVETALRRGKVGTVVATAGTTGFGAVDPIADLVPLAARHGARVHVDAAYGGFHRLLANERVLPAETARHLEAVGDADSVVVDPHKHGLQPYGCGCVLFRDASVGRIYRHDSPYTYFTSDALHLGEISLECSRPGAAAGAFWLTLQAFPLDSTGLGSVLAASRRAAVALHDRISQSDVLASICDPELDIVVYRPRASDTGASVDAASQRIFDLGMCDAHDPLFLSLLRAPARMLRLESDEDAEVRVLRSVMMKPEHEMSVPWMAERLEALAKMVEAADGP